MELMTIKQGLRSTVCCINERAEQAIDIEFSLPDYCPKIERIIKCMLSPRISNVSYSGQSVSIDGEAQITVLYCASNGELSGFETEARFTKNVDCKTDCDKSLIRVNAHPEYVNCRAVNERKLDVHGAITLHINGSCNEQTDIVTGSENRSLQLQRRRIENAEICGFASKQIMVEDELNLTQTLDSIESIIRNDASVCVSDCRFVAGKAIVKGELCVSILYRSVKKNCECFSSVIPIEQMIDIDGVGEDCITSCEAMLCSLKVRAFTDTDGECRSVLVSAKVNVDVTGSRVVESDIISDCYSVTNNLDIERKTVEVRSNAEQVSASHQIRETLEFPENALGQVIDVCCDTGELSCVCSDGMLKVSGSATASVIAKNSDGECACFDRNIPFEHEFKVAQCGECRAEIRANVASCSYSIKSLSNLEIRAQIDIRGTVFCVEKMQVITDINASDNSEKPIVEMPAFILYYASSGESVWKIAMKYNTGAELIMRANSLDDDLLPEARILMIPGM